MPESSQSKCLSALCSCRAAELLQDGGNFLKQDFFLGFQIFMKADVVGNQANPS